MFIVEKSLFSETLSKLNIKTIAPLCDINISSEMLSKGLMGQQNEQNQISIS